MYSFKCPQCQSLLEHDTDITGEHVQCPDCNHTFQIGANDLQCSAGPTASIDAPSRFVCTHCQVTLESDEDLTGQSIQCCECNRRFVADANTAVAEARHAPQSPPNRESKPAPSPQPATTLEPQTTSNAATKKSFPKRIVASIGIAAAIAIAAGAFPYLNSPSQAIANSDATNAETANSVAAKAMHQQFQKQFFSTLQELEDDQLGKPLNLDLIGVLRSKPHPDPKKTRILYRLHTADEDFNLPLRGMPTEINIDDFVDAYVKLSVNGQVISKHCIRSFGSMQITGIEKLPLETVSAFQQATGRTRTPSPNAMEFVGTWGPRMSLPSALWPEDLASFNVAEFAQQINKLTSAAYVMVNVTHPAGSDFFTAPHPKLAQALNFKKTPFPSRDLLGEVLQAIHASGKKALVYFAAEGFRGPRSGEVEQAQWDAYIQSLGMKHVEAVRELLLKHYAATYGDQIDGWWFDGSLHVNTQERIRWREMIMQSNPKAIIAFNRMAGVPFAATSQCDYSGGHPTPRAITPFWDQKVNGPMIETVEQGPWLDNDGAPVKDPQLGALGHVFMGLQDRWNIGGCKFPAAQAIEWTTRVVSAGGMYTWSVPRAGSSMLKGQYHLLLKINQAVEALGK